MEAQAMSAAHFPTTSLISRQKFQVSQVPSIRKVPSLTSTTCIKCENNGMKSDGDGPSKKMFILGMGYVGQFFAHQLKNEGWDISGSCTSTAKKMELEQKGLNAYVFDACRPEWKILDIMSAYSHLLVSVPPLETVGDLVLEHEYFLKSRFPSGNLQWLCYLSSTSIYGDSAGAWVDEDYSPKPLSNSAKMRFRAEEGWLKLGQDLGIPTYVFRLGGIYGPGRSAIDTILKQEELSKSQKRRAGRTFTSRIHVADICQALRASISLFAERNIYNVVDDDPASRAEVFEFAQRLIENRWPDLVSSNRDESLSKSSLPSSTGEKRVSNALMKTDLGVQLLHPSYKSGLQSIVDQMADPISH